MRLLREMQALPALSASDFTEATLAVSLLIPARQSAHALKKTVTEAHAFFSRRLAADPSQTFEIILIPNPSPENSEDQSPRVAEELARDFSCVRVCPHVRPSGKGAALRTGLRSARGRWIFFTDADLPYDLDFFDRAAIKLATGYDLVTGNRRLPSSHFNVPVDLLSVAYSRHRLGLGFNRFVRILLPIRTTDTQAGIKAMTRELALKAFSHPVCPGFFFDLEIFLTATGYGYKHVELPVTLYLNSEKSTVRILRESILAGFWLARITWRNLRGKYGSAHRSTPLRKARQILSKYPGVSPGTRLFLVARWLLTPYQRMANRLPPQGAILDMGCGHGLLALATALTDTRRNVYGVDHDVARIELATQAARHISNIRFEKGSLTDFPERGAYRGIAMIDVMHYFDPSTQERILRDAFARLEKGGTLLVREVDPNGGITSRWNRFYEKLATATGFTRAEKGSLHFRSRPEWENLLSDLGFQVSSERCSSILFSDVLFICERPQ